MLPIFCKTVFSPLSLQNQARKSSRQSSLADFSEQKKTGRSSTQMDERPRTMSCAKVEAQGKRWSVENEVEKFVHDILVGHVALPHTLESGIGLSQLADDLHCLHG